MIECEKRYFKLCTCSGVDGARDDEDGGDAVSFFCTTFSHSKFDSQLWCEKCFLHFYWLLLHTEMHTLCSNGTKVCTENQNRCCLLLLFFFFSLSFVNLFVCQSDGWLACVRRVKKDWLRARNSRSGCIYFEFENNIFTMSSLYLSFECVFG